jgi:hypothetical protein
MKLYPDLNLDQCVVGVLVGWFDLPHSPHRLRCEVYWERREIYLETALAIFVCGGVE